MTHVSTQRPTLWKRKRAVGAMVIAAALVVLATTLGPIAGRTTDQEVQRVVEVMALREGMRVAEIGAGAGWLTVEVARHVGDSGCVYSTELSPRRLDQIREAVAGAGLTNVIVTEAAERASNLPAGCCDAVYMRRVYHHFDDPSAILRDLRHALVDGGRLVIIEFESGGTLGTVTGMGIDRTRLTAEVSADGFELVTIDDWPGWNHYVAVFAKPGSVAPSQPRGGA